MDIPTLELESALLKDGHFTIAGVDEVGRGSWAGPVVAVAVILPLEDPNLLFRLDGVRDSKQLSAAQRDRCLRVILQCAVSVGCGWSTQRTIDAIGIAAANKRAMARAINALRVAPHALLLDHVALHDVPLPQLSIPRGDARSLSIASASVVAKVLRDRWMVRCDARFPEYGFGAHKGYGTRRHQEALARLGPCAIHRRSFAPVSAALQ